MSATFRFPLWLWAIVTGVFAWSAIAPKDRFTWFLEVLPAFLGAVVLLATRKRFPLTPLLQTLIAIHMIILMVGGHYTYAEVPLFNYLRDVFHLSRNHYDRVGHFAQGFVPAIIAREVLLRRSPLVSGKWLSFIVICICLAISAVYELFEWTVAVLTGESATAFLGTQGDVWDTQKDMAFCAAGAVCALILLTRWHDRQVNVLSR
jgi:putative membrane protein